ncbi:PAQR family membrane homeostasis protein TrhA [Salininema proteolyticum]|uniref:Hemolysin III family protein n=1 Tax=Salininema proteolyticum TaxID=1607685 RepID=A0ABV8TUN0_9ACTN
MRPRYRGVLHLVALPLALAAGLALTALAPTVEARLATAVFTATSACLFGVSALYHRSHVSPAAALRLKRLDHANIYLAIAGTYTPVAALALSGTTRTVILAVVWAGAGAGVVFRVFWPGAPRALYTGLYIALGWTILPVLPALVDSAGTLPVALLLAGGVLYTLGAVVYARKSPDPVPDVFGFHEVFHAFTVAAWAAQFSAVALVVSGL